MTRMVKGLNPLSYQGVTAGNPPNLIKLKRAPTTADSKNFNIGDFWLDTTARILYQLVSLANDVAVWDEVSTPAGVGTVFFDTDAGTAQDLIQRIIMAGGSNINTSGAGNTVTFNLDNTVTISGTFTTTGGNINVDAGRLSVTRTATNEGQIFIISTTVDAVSGDLIFIKDRALGAVNVGDNLGDIKFDGYDAPLSSVTAAQIRSSVPSGTTVAANRVAGQLIFSTHPDSTGALADRMTIDHTGLVTIEASTTTDTLLVEKPVGNFAAVTAFTLENNADPVVIRTAKRRIAAAVQPNDGLGVYSFDGYDGTSTHSAAYISASVPNATTVAAGRLPANIGLYTGPDSVSSPLLRAVIYFDGKGQINFPDTAFAPGDDFTTWTVYGTRAVSGIPTGYANSQWVEGQTSVQTSDAMATPILQIPVAAQQMVLVKAQVSGFQDDFSDSIVADVFFGVYRPTASNVTLIVTPAAPVPTIFTTSTTTVANVVDVGSQEARITVTGVALETHNWVCKYSYMYLVDDN